MVVGLVWDIAGEIAGLQAVHEWQAGLIAAGLSPSRIRNAAQVLGQILDAAVPGGRRHRNPAQGLRRPRIVEREMSFLSATELERFASQITDPYGVLVRFLGWTGLRIGEAAALRVGRLDLLGRRIEVVKAATEVNGRLAWGSTKTGERRTVPLPHFLPSSSAPTSPTGRTAPRIWCSLCPRRRGRCGPPSGASGTFAGSGGSRAARGPARP